MKPKKRQKLCHHCEGEVDLDVIVCPFCAADLREEKPELQRVGLRTAGTDRLQGGQSLYPSHYNRPAAEEPVATQPQEAVAEQGEERADVKSTVYGTTLLALGAYCLLLGFLMLFCSHGGVLLLRWNATLWPFYLLGALPLFIFGLRFLKRE